MPVTTSVPFCEPRRPTLMVSPSSVGAGRLAEDAVVEFFAALGGPLQELDGAVDGDAFLVAGDQERDRALGRAAGEMIERGRDRAGDGALHVDRAAAVERVADDLAGKRRARPGGLVAGRNDVGVAGEHQMRRAGADAGVEIVHRRSAGLGKGDAVDGETCARQHAFQQRKRAALGRRHRRAAHEIAGERDGVGCHRPPLRSRQVRVNGRLRGLRAGPDRTGSGRRCRAGSRTRSAPRPTAQRQERR